ncbi:hypothetical protein DMENIID0001_137630 [Sergentomyia squamirostris]
MPLKWAAKLKMTKHTRNLSWNKLRTHSQAEACGQLLMGSHHIIEPLLNSKPMKRSHHEDDATADIQKDIDNKRSDFSRLTSPSLLVAPEFSGTEIHSLRFLGMLEIHPVYVS